MEISINDLVVPGAFKTLKCVSSGDMNGVTSTTVQIPKVDPNNSFVLLISQGLSSSASPFDPGQHLGRVDLATDGLSLTFTRGVSGSDAFILFALVVELWPGCVRSIQHVTGTAASPTASVLPVDPDKTLVIPRGAVSTTDSITNANFATYGATLTSETVVTFTAGVNTVTVYATVVEMN